MDELNISAIKKYIQFPCEIAAIDTSPSTNMDVKRLGKEGAPEGTVLITEHQTAGRGRLGKQFFSPRGCGLYFSVLLRPVLPAKDAVLITVAAAVAMKRAVKSLTNLDTQIKWVNDIYGNNKKFCGILTEAALSPQGGISYAVLGVGVNLLPPPGGYPDDFAMRTTNLWELTNGTLPKDLKNQLISAFLNAFFDCYKNLGEKAYLAEYRAASCLIGKEIEILSGCFTGPAVALDIDDNANLVAQLPSGKTVTLSSGDVSIRI